MAQAQVEEPGKVGAFTVDELKKTINTVFITGPPAPAVAVDPLTQAQETVKLWEVWQVVSKDRPRKGPARDLYDYAMKKLGDDNALRDVTRALKDSITQLAKATTSPADVGANKESLQAILTTIGEKAQTDERYIRFYDESFMRTVAGLHRVLGGGEFTAAINVLPPGEEEAGPIIAGTQETFRPERERFNPGRYHIIRSDKQTKTFAVGGTVTPDLEFMFGGNNSYAEAAMSSLANAFAAEANGEPQDFGTEDLHEALGRVTNQQLLNNPDFQSAMNHLENGRRSEALRDLARLGGPGGPLNALFDEANNLHIISIDQEAMVIFHAGVSVKFDWMGNYEAFQKYAQSQTTGSYEPALLYLGLGMYYDLLGIKGWAAPTTYDVETGTSTTGEKTPVKGKGHVVGFVPEIAFGAGIRGQPIQIVVHTQLGYREWSTDPITIPVQGGEEREIIQGPKEFFVGFTGIEVQLPRKAGKEPLFWFESAGVGWLGNTDARSVLGHFTVSGNWLREGNVRISSELTPQLGYVLDAFRYGGTVEPINIAAKIRKEMELRFSPSLRVVHDIETDIVRYELIGKVGFEPTKGFAINLTGGYIWDRAHAAPEIERDYKDAESMNLGIEFAFELPELFSGRDRELHATPRPVEVTGIPADLYLEASDLLAAGTEDEIQGNRGSFLAEDLGRALDRYAQDELPSVAANDTFIAAVEELRLGHLREGMELLRQLAVFRALE